jgi:hypothetical protein
MLCRENEGSMSRAWFAAVILLAVSAAGSAQEARPGTPGWTATAEGCRVWNEDPQPDERVSWTGACVEGLIEGRGVLRWMLPDGNDTYDGEISKGRPNGRGTYSWRDGDRYEGEWRNGAMHGRGTYS